MNLMGFLHIVVCLCYILKNYIILTTQFLFSTQLFEIKTVQPDEQEKLVTNLSLFSSCFFFFKFTLGFSVEYGLLTDWVP